MVHDDKNAKIISFIIIAVLLMTIWYMLDLALLTFFLTFIFYHLSRIVQNRFDKVCPIPIPNGLILTTCYLVFILALTMFIAEILPVIGKWGKVLADLFIGMNISSLLSDVDPRIMAVLNFIDINSMIKNLGVTMSSYIASYSTQVAGFLINLLLSLLLSFIILIEKKKIQKFGENLEKSRFSDVYKYLVKFGGNFSATFGKVMTVQLTIAFVNSILSMIALGCMGFPGIPALGIMIFFLGLIPVAGVIISMIPLCIIALSIGGFVKVIEVIIMICVLHAIEAYILNPKLMSNKTRLPVCFVFIILLVGEHYLGVWGLLIGVPIFIFLMNMLEVDYQVEGEKHAKKKKKEQNT